MLKILLKSVCFWYFEVSLIVSSKEIKINNKKIINTVVAIPTNLINSIGVIVEPANIPNILALFENILDLPKKYAIGVIIINKKLNKIKKTLTFGLTVIIIKLKNSTKTYDKPIPNMLAIIRKFFCRVFVIGVLLEFLWLL